MIPTPSRSFTLVETLVAIAIVSIAMVGPFQAVQNALSLSYIARDQIIATNLAQEGIEYVRSIRDANYLYKLQNTSTSRTWLYGIDGTDSSGGGGGGTNCVSSNGCVVDPTQGTISVCPSGTCAPLNLSSTHLYNQSSVSSTNIATPFVRKVTLTTVTGYQTTVNVTVTWKTLGKTYTVNVNENIYNWL